MKNSGTWWIIAAIMVLLDFYVFQALKTVTQNTSEKTKVIVHGIYWLVAAATIISLVSFPYIQALQTNKVFRNYIFAIMLGLFIAKLIGSAFFLIDDLRRLTTWVVAKFSSSEHIVGIEESNGISRSVFLSWLGLGCCSFISGLRRRRPFLHLRPGFEGPCPDQPICGGQSARRRRSVFCRCQSRAPH